MAVAAYREENIDRIRQYDRERGHRQTVEYKRLYRIRDPRRSHCGWAVYHAVKTGKLKRQPCELCGAARSVAHHESYDQPLAVRWLCQLHHKERHKEMKLEGITP